jgi:hypothetical protein
MPAAPVDMRQQTLCPTPRRATSCHCFPLYMSDHRCCTARSAGLLQNNFSLQAHAHSGHCNEENYSEGANGFPPRGSSTARTQRAQAASPIRFKHNMNTARSPALLPNCSDMPIATSTLWPDVGLTLGASQKLLRAGQRPIPWPVEKLRSPEACGGYLQRQWRCIGNSNWGWCLEHQRFKKGRHVRGHSQPPCRAPAISSCPATITCWKDHNLPIAPLLRCLHPRCRCRSSQPTC